MLQVARLAPNELGEAAPRVTAFFESQLGAHGAGLDRSGEPDLYYTVFCLDGLTAMQAVAPATTVGWLRGLGAGEELDLVHAACLARCWAAADGSMASEHRTALATHLEAHRDDDGSYGPRPGAPGSIYHSFLAAGALEDLGLPQPRAPELAQAVLARRTADGGFGAAASGPGSTTVTAAAVTLLRSLSRTGAFAAPLPSCGEFLLAQAHPEGGFRAGPGAPIPDLLSTATALHAASILGVDVRPLVEPTLDFVDTLWTGQGFCGNWTDEAVDAEYTFYGLLALGHLHAAA